LSGLALSVSSSQEATKIKTNRPFVLFLVSNMHSLSRLLDGSTLQRVASLPKSLRKRVRV
jgi:hypothetical protein